MCTHVIAVWRRIRASRRVHAVALLALFLLVWFALAALLSGVALWIGCKLTPPGNPSGITVPAMVLMSLATLLVAVAALFKEQVLDLLIPVRLQIVPHRVLEGTFVRLDSQGRQLNTRYYSLAVRNPSEYRTARNCSVVLTRVSHLTENGFRDEIPNCEFPFVWAPSGLVPNRLDIRARESEPFDLLSVPEVGSPRLELQFCTTNFNPHLPQGVTVRVWLQAKADGCRGGVLAIWEVRWTPTWADDKRTCRPCITLDDVSARVKDELTAQTK
jgi:hypothetical protein